MSLITAISLVITIVTAIVAAVVGYIARQKIVDSKVDSKLSELKKIEKNNYGTYSLEFEIENIAAIYGIEIPPVYGSYEDYLNETKIKKLLGKKICYESIDSIITGVDLLDSRYVVKTLDNHNLMVYTSEIDLFRRNEKNGRLNYYF